MGHTQKKTQEKNNGNIFLDAIKRIFFMKHDTKRG